MVVAAMKRYESRVDMTVANNPIMKTAASQGDSTSDASAG